MKSELSANALALRHVMASPSRSMPVLLLVLVAPRV
jgi:hypothetical protein